jgi:hypothetical protein
MSFRRFALLALMLGPAGCRMSSSPSPAAVESGAYVVRLGNDTLAVHQYSRAGDRIEGAVLQHLPRTQITRYVLTLNPGGTPSLLEFNTRLPDGGLIPNGARSVTVTFIGDSAVTQVQRDTLLTTRVAAKDAFPLLGNAMSLYALPIAKLRASNADSVMVSSYGGGVRATPVSVVRKGQNRYWVTIGGPPYLPWEITTNDRGQVETVDGARTTQHFFAQRQASVDIPGTMARFAQAEAAARPPAQLSSRDTVNATVGSAQLWVDYGRPLTRGRKVFGANGVLGDTIWRTGANAATQFRTSVPIVMAGQTIPPGMYTLWTLAIPGRYQLIINRQTGQWGTAYNAAQDLARVPLQATQLPTVVERFTIVVEPTAANAGVLRLRWDTTDLSVPFTLP